VEASSNSNLLRAIQARDASKVAALLAQYDNSATERTASCPLHYACQLGYSEIVAELLKHPSCLSAINEFDDISYTPLMYAAKHGDVGLVDLLITAGADVNARDESRIGNTVLREVIETAHPRMVKALLDRGADPRIEGWMQLTAVDKANERYERERSSDAAEIVDLISRR